MSRINPEDASVDNEDEALQTKLLDKPDDDVDEEIYNHMMEKTYPKPPSAAGSMVKSSMGRSGIT
jgi:hypothetical protein